MPHPKDLENIKKGVEFWNNWRREHKHIIPDLRGADFTNHDYLIACQSNRRQRFAEFYSGRHYSGAD